MIVKFINSLAEKVLLGIPFYTAPFLEVQYPSRITAA